MSNRSSYVNRIGTQNLSLLGDPLNHCALPYNNFLRVQYFKHLLIFWCMPRRVKIPFITLFHLVRLYIQYSCFDNLKDNLIENCLFDNVS